MRSCRTLGSLLAGLTCLLLSVACGEEPHTDPPVDPMEGPGTEVDPTIANRAAWPALYPADAWRPIAEGVRAGAGLPSVPTDYATASQSQALSEARNLTQRLGLNSTKRDLALRLANLYATNLFPDRAMSVLGLCLELELEHPLTLKLTAASLSAAGRFEDAACLLEHVGSLSPDDHAMAGPLFTVYWELGETGAARAALDRGLELNPHSPHLAMRMGQVLFEDEGPEPALEYLERAAVGLPNDTEAWHRYASCLEELERWDEATPAREKHGLLVQMIEFGVGDLLPWTERLELLAEALEASGDPEGAARARKALP